jgi:hypothetical protein
VPEEIVELIEVVVETREDVERVQAARQLKLHPYTMAEGQVDEPS